MQEQEGSSRWGWMRRAPVALVVLVVTLLAWPMGQVRAAATGTFVYTDVALYQDITQIIQKVDSVYYQVTEVKKDTADLQTKVASVTTKLNSVGADASRGEALGDINMAKLNQNAASIADVKALVNGVATKLETTRAAAARAEALGDINMLKLNQNASSIGTVDQRVQTVGGYVSTVGADVTASRSKLDSVGTDVTNSRSKLDSVGIDVTNSRSKLDSVGVDVAASKEVGYINMGKANQSLAALDSLGVAVQSARDLEQLTNDAVKGLRTVNDKAHGAAQAGIDATRSLVGEAVNHVTGQQDDLDALRDQISALSAQVAAISAVGGTVDNATLDALVRSSDSILGKLIEIGRWYQGDCPDMGSVGLYAAMPAASVPTRCTTHASELERAAQGIKQKLSELDEARKEREAAAEAADQRRADAAEQAIKDAASAVGRAVSSGADRIEEGLSGVVSAVKAAGDRQVDKLEEVKRAIEGIKIPAPVVNVPAPNVNVQAPNVNVEAPNVNVTVPGTKTDEGVGFGLGRGTTPRLDGWTGAFTCLGRSVGAVGGGGSTCGAGPAIDLAGVMQWRPLSWCGSDLGWTNVKSILGVGLLLAAALASLRSILAGVGVVIAPGGGE